VIGNFKHQTSNLKQFFPQFQNRYLPLTRVVKLLKMTWQIVYGFNLEVENASKDCHYHWACGLVPFGEHGVHHFGRVQ
jgi:hypothetical protein